MPTNFDCFLSFFRQKIKEGERQVDLAASPMIGKSPQYLNRFIKGDPKSCPLDVQEGVAAYYSLSYEKMIEEGRKIYELENPAKLSTGEGKVIEIEGKVYEISDPEEQKDLLKRIEGGITKNSKVLETLKKRIDLLENIFEHLNEGVTFFDSERKFVFSSNRWNFLDGVDLDKNPTIDTIVITIRKKIENLNEVLDIIYKVASNPQNEEEVDVNFKNGYVFNFRIVPLFEEDVFLGTLLVNTLKSVPKPQDN